MTYTISKYANKNHRPTQTEERGDGEEATGSLSEQSRLIANGTTASACYFRSGPEPGHRKALLKITDRCDLRCSHCFVSATAEGEDMSSSALRGAIERLLGARVTNVTLTGGEPLVHPDLLQILSDLVAAGLNITVCTNGVSVSDGLIRCASELGRVSFNVSLDGAQAASHGKFRGDLEAFERTTVNARRLSEAGLLKGILSTPNSLANADEYLEILGMASELHASYFLLNPLSSFGRGIQNRRLAVAEPGCERFKTGSSLPPIATAPSGFSSVFPIRRNRSLHASQGIFSMCS